MGRFLLTFLFITGLSFSHSTQANNIDSLKHLAETSPFPERINHLIDWYVATGELFHEHEIGMMQSGIDWLVGLPKLDKRQQLIWATLTLMQGSMYADNERLSDLFENASSVVVMADSVGGDSKSWLQYKGDAYFQLKSVCYLEERYEESLEYLEKAKAAFEELGNNRLIARTLNSMGAQERELGNYQKSFDLSAQAAELYRKEEFEHGYLRADYYQSSALIDMGKYLEAEQMLLDMIPKMEEANHVSWNAALSSLGEVQMKLNKTEAAESNLAEALEMAKKRRVNYTVANVCQLLANLEEERGNYAEALFYQREQAKYADSIRLQATEAQLKRAQAEFEQFENEKKIKELEGKIALEKRSKLWLISGGIVLLIGVIGAFWYFYQKKKKEFEAAARTVSLNIKAESVTDNEPSVDPFLEEFLQIVRERLGEETLSVESIAQNLRMSRVQLFKKVKAASGASPSAIIREYRLEMGKRLLLEKSLNVSEVAYRVGFSNPNSFSRAFKDKFGSSPSVFLEGNKPN